MYKYFAMSVFAAAIVYAGTVIKERLGTKGGKAALVFSYCAAAFLFCALAGIRGAEVGTDVQIYAIPAFDFSQDADFFDFSAETKFARWMPLSKLLFWGVSASTHSLFCLLFVVHAVIVIPLFVGLQLVLKDKAWLGVLVFGLVFFPISLNIMRQFMGMGFLILAYFFVLRRKPWLFFLFVAIGVLFHETCIIGALIYPIWLLSSGKLNRFVFGPAVLGLTVLASIQIFFPILRVIAPIFGPYSTYINGLVATTDGGGGTRELTVIITICLILGFMYKALMDGKGRTLAALDELSGLAGIVFVGIAFFSLCVYSFQLFRLGVFFLYFVVLLIPKAYERIPGNYGKRTFLFAAVSLLTLFGHAYYGTGSHEVVPYVVDIVGKF